jgi:hypothetical protein
MAPRLHLCDTANSGGSQRKPPRLLRLTWLIFRRFRIGRRNLVSPHRNLLVGPTTLRPVVAIQVMLLGRLLEVVVLVLASSTFRTCVSTIQR